MSDVRLDNAPALLAQVAAGEVTLAEVASAVRLAADGARQLNTFIHPPPPGPEGGPVYGRTSPPPSVSPVSGSSSPPRGDPPPMSRSW